MRFDLIPCPDCGSAAKLEEGRYRGTSQIYSYVHCTNPLCHLSRYTLHFVSSSPQKSDEIAASTWNERYAGVVCERNTLSTAKGAANTAAC